MKRHINILRNILLISLLSLSGAMPAAAQMCNAAKEVIVTLREPQIGVPTVWDAVFKDKDNMVQLMSGLPLQGGTVFAVGRVLSKKNYQPLETVLVELNRRGRVLNEKRYPSKDGELPIKMIALNKGYLVVSNIRGGKGKGQRQVRLAWYNDDGDFKKQQILKDGEFDYDAYGVHKAVDGDGFVVVIHAINRRDENDHNGMIMRFTSDGSRVWSRAYRPGIPNQLAGVTPVAGGHYIATGRIRIDDGRMAGWVMKLSYDGTVLWQRIYPRGAFAVLRSAAMPDGTIEEAEKEEGGGFLVYGEAKPADGNPDAAWIMAIDPFGEPEWQRYYRRTDFSFSPAGLMVIEDGRIILAMNAKAEPGSKERDHVRMITLASHGVIVDDESYIEGIEAEAKDFVRGWNGERVVTTTILSDSVPLMQIDPEESGNAETQPPVEEPLQKGWIFVATALDPYDDPCKKKRKGR